MISESKIETHLTRLVEGVGGLTFKFTSAVAGVPDRIVIHKGKVYLVEVKKPDGEVSKIQQHQHDEISKRGVDVYTLWSFNDVENFVDLIG